MAGANTLYSIGELQDLIAAKTANTSGDVNAYQKLSAAWQASDAASAAKWLSDWQAMIAKFNGAVSDANSAISLAQLQSKMTLGIEPYTSFEGTTAYQEVLTALNPSWASGTKAPGSFDDLDARLQVAASTLGQTIAPIVIPQPQYDSGLNPNSWQGYATGLASKLGLVNPADVPPGTPGGPKPNDPPLIPTWLKWCAGGGFALFVAAKVKEIL